MKRQLGKLWLRYRNSRYIRPILLFLLFFVIAGIGATLIETGRNSEEFDSILDGIWWSIITFSTTGYGDMVPVTVLGRILAILTIFLGIAAMSLLSGALASFLVERNTRARSGLMDFKGLRGHLIICGWREDMKDILQDILRASGELGADQLVIISNVEPEKVEALQNEETLHELKFVRGDYYSEAALVRANVREARKVVIIADALESSAVSEVDSKTVMAVLTAKSLARDVYVTAEILDRKYESYLKHVQCDEILFSRDFARQMLASSSVTNGLSHVVQELLGQGESGARLVTFDIPGKYVDGPYGEFRKSVLDNGGKQVLLGVLVNTGSPNAMKMEALRQAQKTSDVSQLIANMQKVRGLEVNQPLLLPDDDYQVQRHSVAIVLERD